MQMYKNASDWLLFYEFWQKRENVSINLLHDLLLLAWAAQHRSYYPAAQSWPVMSQKLRVTVKLIDSLNGL